MVRWGFLLVLFATNTALATVALIDDIPTMTTNSDVILHGVIGEQTTKMDRDGRLVTYSTLEILDGLKGTKTGQLVTLYQVGGSVAGLEYYVSGAQKYRIGEEVVLFGVDLDNMVVSYGVGVGKFRIIRSGKEARVVEELHDLIEAKPAPHGEWTFREPRPREFSSLSSLKKLIRSSLAKTSQIMQPPKLPPSQVFIPNRFAPYTKPQVGGAK